MLKIFLESANIECRPNLVSFSRLYLYFTKNGHPIVSDPSEASYIIINTCGVTQQFAEHSAKLFNRYTKNANTLIISIGCLNTIDISMITEFPDVLVITNLDDLDDIFYKDIKFRDVTESYITESMGMKNLGERSYLTSFVFLSSLLHPVLKKSHIYNTINRHITRKDKIFIEIGSGCIGRCSYCIIKKAKGEPVSRKPDDILSDIKKVYKPGKYIDFVADDCGSYGADIGSTLPELINKISESYPGVPLDITYLNPWWLVRHEDEYINLFGNTTINSINISMQSGSHKIVKLMNRSYNPDEVLRIMETIRRISPGTCIWTHIMVGFPGESWKDFWKTIKIITYFDASLAFIYSPRAETKSITFKNNNSNLTINMRCFIAGSYAKIISLMRIIRDLFTAE